MAIREIRVVGDRVLTKKCRPVEKMTETGKTAISRLC